MDRCCAPVRDVVELLRDGLIDDHERRALLDALGHGDCVSREQYENAEHYAQEGWSWVDDALKALGVKDVFGIWAERTRAERTEVALRGAVRAFDEVDRCAWLLQQAINNGDSDYIDAAVEQYERSHDEMCMGPDAPMSQARAALSADADADAEPCAHESREESGGWAWCPDCRHGWPADGLSTADAEPERRSPHADYKSRVEYRPGDAEPSRAEGDRTCGLHSLENERTSITHAPSCPRAAGGRPREADPQGPSIGSDASVDGGGDDGRSRAEEAIVSAVCDRFGGGTPLLDSNIPVGELARTAIDAALASGGVFTREEVEQADSIEAETAAERDRAQARVRELEAALRYYADWTSWDRGKRARAALEGGQ